MNKKLNCIMLIDDNDTTNFIHARIIKRADVTEQVIAFNEGEKALSYLVGIQNENYDAPDLIFLDINMPKMNGWEFLAEYEKLDAKLQNSIVIMLLTTSLNNDDDLKAKKSKLLNGFLNKPLTKDGLKQLIKKHFQTAID